ncbi:MAG TPA: hypothetical protein VFZ97_05135 [Acidimicrobiales bacterium]
MTAVDVSARVSASDTQANWARWGGISGIVFAPLLAAAVLMTAGMPAAKHAAKVQAWDVKHTGLLGASLVLTALAVVVGLYFFTWLHFQFTRSERSWMGTMFVTGAILFGASGTIAAGLQATLSQDAKHLSTGSLQLMASLSQNFNYPMTTVGLALMFLAAGFLIRRTRLLPGWLAWVSWVLAFAAATVILGFIALLGTALWVIVVGAIFTVRRSAKS